MKRTPGALCHILENRPFFYNFTAPRVSVTLPPASLRLLNDHFCAMTIAKPIPKIPRHDSCFCHTPVLY